MRRTLLALLSTLTLTACTTPESPPGNTDGTDIATRPDAPAPAAPAPAEPPAKPDAPQPGVPVASPDAPREIHFSYAVTIPVPPAGTQVLRVWVPVAMKDDGVQEVHDLVVNAPEGYRVTTDPLYGNTSIYVEVDNPTAPVQIAWTARIVRDVDLGQGTGPMTDRYVRPDKLVPTDGLALELANQLRATDTARTLPERASAIYMDVLDNMAYDKKHDGWGRGSFEHATTVCKGNCTDFHARFIGIGRAAGIPVRFTMGIPLGKSEPGTHTYDSYHCWAHWHDGHRWQPVDISEADKIVEKDREGALRFNGRLPTNRVGLTVGRDVVLEPAQSGEPLNYFVFPYAEADGAAFELPKGVWTFEYTNK